MNYHISLIVSKDRVWLHPLFISILEQTYLDHYFDEISEQNLMLDLVSGESCSYIDGRHIINSFLSNNSRHLEVKSFYSIRCDETLDFSS